jgi:hypothetical protein
MNPVQSSKPFNDGPPHNEHKVASVGLAGGCPECDVLWPTVVTDADRIGADPAGVELDAAAAAAPASASMDLEDPDAMWVGGAGGGWRAPPPSAPIRRGSDSPALYNTTLMTVRALIISRTLSQYKTHKTIWPTPYIYFAPPRY